MQGRARTCLRDTRRFWWGLGQLAAMATRRSAPDLFTISAPGLPAAGSGLYRKKNPTITNRQTLKPKEGRQRKGPKSRKKAKYILYIRRRRHTPTHTGTGHRQHGHGDTARLGTALQPLHNAQSHCATGHWSHWSSLATGSHILHLVAGTPDTRHTTTRLLLRTRAKK